MIGMEATLEHVVIPTCPFSFGMLPLITVGEFGTKRIYLGKTGDQVII